MSLFSSIMHKIFGSAAAAPQPVTEAGAAPPAAGQVVGTQPDMPAVDVEAVLTSLAAQKGGGGNWKTSIVDLLKMLDLDSSLPARKELAKELKVSAGADGSAEQNIALSRAVWRKLAQNGGQVPASLRN